MRCVAWQGSQHKVASSFQSHLETREGISYCFLLHGSGLAGHGCRLEEGKFRLDVKKKSFAQRAVRRWLCSQRSGCPSLELPEATGGL